MRFRFSMDVSGRIMCEPSFLDLPDSGPESADVILLPLPFEGTVCYGKGTGEAPRAILAASAHVETWDDELEFDLESPRYHTAAEIRPNERESTAEYLTRVGEASAELNRFPGLLIGIGGEHSLTPPLVRAAAGDPDDLSALTVVQFDAHADLRDSYEGTLHSHACAMRRLVERGATVIAIGIRSAERDEAEYGRASGRVRTFLAQELAENPAVEAELLQTLLDLSGDVYLTFDVDGLEPALCPGTGTPQPGGLAWWQTLRYLRQLLRGNRQRRLIGCDLVECVPQPHTQVNEFTAARLLTKIVAYCFAASGG